MKYTFLSLISFSPTGPFSETLLGLKPAASLPTEAPELHVWRAVFWVATSAGIAIALTFAFGARESARNSIAGFYIRQHLQPDQQLTFDTYSGTVRISSGAYTVLVVTRETGEQSTIAVPNALLLRRAVLSQEHPPADNPSPAGNRTSS